MLRPLALFFKWADAPSPPFGRLCYDTPDLTKLHCGDKPQDYLGRGVAALASLRFYQGRNIALVKPPEL